MRNSNTPRRELVNGIVDSLYDIYREQSANYITVGELLYFGLERQLITKIEYNNCYNLLSMFLGCYIIKEGEGLT